MIHNTKVSMNKLLRYCAMIAQTPNPLTANTIPENADVNVPDKVAQKNFLN